MELFLSSLFTYSLTHSLPHSPRAVPCRTCHTPPVSPTHPCHPCCSPLPSLTSCFKPFLLFAYSPRCLTRQAVPCRPCHTPSISSIPPCHPCLSPFIPLTYFMFQAFSFTRLLTPGLTHNARSPAVRVTSLPFPKLTPAIPAIPFTFPPVTSCFKPLHLLGYPLPASLATPVPCRPCHPCLIPSSHPVFPATPLPRLLTPCLTHNALPPAIPVSSSPLTVSMFPMPLYSALLYAFFPIICYPLAFCPAPPMHDTYFLCVSFASGLSSSFSEPFCFILFLLSSCFASLLRLRVLYCSFPTYSLALHVYIDSSPFLFYPSLSLLILLPLSQLL